MLERDGAGPTIAYRCVKLSHQAAPSRVGRGGLVPYQRGWAYCDGLDVDEDHVWQPTGGVTLASVINWENASAARPRPDVDLDAAVR
ncbi:MAG TPA: hypothetical protein VFM93_13515 [Candidatus Limnocylindria bacterium]|nr:hypothetical protein [Candidatus Limnocylindria bacterium]